MTSNDLTASSLVFVNGGSVVPVNDRNRTDRRLNIMPNIQVQNHTKVPSTGIYSADIFPWTM